MPYGEVLSNCRQHGVLWWLTSKSGPRSEIPNDSAEKREMGFFGHFFVDGFLVCFFFFPWCFFLWPLQTVFSHPCMMPSAGQEAITSFYKCRVICLLTFDLYLAIEWLCFRCYSPSELKPSLLSLFLASLPVLAVLHERELPSGLCLHSRVWVSLALPLASHSYVLI